MVKTQTVHGRVMGETHISTRFFLRETQQDIYHLAFFVFYVAGLKSAGNLYFHPVSRRRPVSCSSMDTPKSKQGPAHLLVLVHGIMAR
jgi:hypothetical protein